LVLSVVRGVSKWSRCVGFLCHRQTAATTSSDMQWLEPLAALVHSDGSRETACCPKGPRPDALGRLEVPFLCFPPCVGHELQPRLEQVECRADCWLAKKRYYDILFKLELSCTLCMRIHPPLRPPLSPPWTCMHHVHTRRVRRCGWLYSVLGSLT
jgi:hypothetical protein